MQNAVPLQLSLCHQYGDNVVNTICEGTTEQIYLAARIIMKLCTVHFMCVCVCVCMCIYIYIYIYIYIKWAYMYLQVQAFVL